jgi:hypothetical protein
MIMTMPQAGDTESTVLIEVSTKQAQAAAQAEVGFYGTPPRLIFCGHAKPRLILRHAKP